jgi:phospholipid transport system transporter-binding protein
VIERNGDTLKLSGPLTLQTVKALYDRGLLADGSASLVIDLTQVEAVDSSGVSLLLSWLREAQRSNISLHFSNVPHNLMSLAKLYGVADMLPVNGSAAT